MDEYFIDTNIFMYAAGKPREFKEPCVDILSRIQSGELNAAIDTEVFQEILYRYHHINLPDKGADLARNMTDLGLNVLPAANSEPQPGKYEQANKYQD